MPDRADAAALAARAAGQPALAVTLWHQVLRRSPAQWRAALELRTDLRAIGQYPQADALFRRAAEHMPDAEWLAHYAAIYAVHHDELDGLAQRAGALAEREPGNAAAQMLLGDLARQRRDYATAEQGFAAAAALLHPDADAKLHLVRALRRVAARLAQDLAQGPVSGDTYAVAYLNLAGNTERRAEIERQFAGCPVPLLRIDGVNGASLPAHAINRLVHDPTPPRGTLGCFLSHAAAWQTMLDQGLPHLLVVEDDVMPVLDLPPRLGPLGLPPDYALCFVNDRMQPLGQDDGAGGFVVTPLADAMRRFPPEENAPGADGYLISAAGARQLLAWLATDRYDGDVDWRLLAYSLLPGQVADLPRHGHAWAALDRLHPRRSERLDAYALSPPLIRTVPVSSDREDGNRAGDAQAG